MSEASSEVFEASENTSGNPERGYTKLALPSAYKASLYTHWLCEAKIQERGFSKKYTTLTYVLYKRKAYWFYFFAELSKNSFLKISPSTS